MYIINIFLSFMFSYLLAVLLYNFFFLRKHYVLVSNMTFFIQFPADKAIYERFSSFGNQPINFLSTLKKWLDIKNFPLASTFLFRKTR